MLFCVRNRPPDQVPATSSAHSPYPDHSQLCVRYVPADFHLNPASGAGSASGNGTERPMLPCIRNGPQDYVLATNSADPSGAKLCVYHAATVFHTPAIAHHSIARRGSLAAAVLSCVFLGPSSTFATSAVVDALAEQPPSALHCVVSHLAPATASSRDDHKVRRRCERSARLLLNTALKHDATRFFGSPLPAALEPPSQRATTSRPPASSPVTRMEVLAPKSFFPSKRSTSSPRAQPATRQACKEPSRSKSSAPTPGPTSSALRATSPPCPQPGARQPPKLTSSPSPTKTKTTTAPPTSPQRRAVCTRLSSPRIAPKIPASSAASACSPTMSPSKSPSRSPTREPLRACSPPRGRTDAEARGVGAMSWAGGVRLSLNSQVHLVAYEARQCSPRF
jgi:hypothetical protein